MARWEGREMGGRGPLTCVLSPRAKASESRGFGDPGCHCVRALRFACPPTPARLKVFRDAGLCGVVWCVRVRVCVCACVRPSVRVSVC